ncbi:MAG: SnoaL-like domain-containing protein [Lysobacter sp.]|nr:SnoaL-like domain-containing protein [Lysobacter sp.]
MRRLVLAASLLFALAGAPAFAQSPAHAQPATPSAEAMQANADEAARVVDSFMTALIGGQLETARQMMLPDAVVMSNGQILGTRDGYIDGAAKADSAALRNVQRELVDRGAKAGANLGWVVSEKRLRGAAGTQGPRELMLSETMLLMRTEQGWKIAHIHWSGRTAG